MGCLRTANTLAQARISFAFFTTLFREIWGGLERNFTKFGASMPKFRCERNLGAFTTKFWPRPTGKSPGRRDAIREPRPSCCTKCSYAATRFEIRNGNYPSYRNIAVLSVTECMSSSRAISRRRARPASLRQPPSRDLGAAGASYYYERHGRRPCSSC